VGDPAAPVANRPDVHGAYYGTAVLAAKLLFEPADAVLRFNGGEGLRPALGVKIKLVFYVSDGSQQVLLVGLAEYACKSLVHDQKAPFERGLEDPEGRVLEYALEPVRALPDLTDHLLIGFQTPGHKCLQLELVANWDNNRWFSKRFPIHDASGSKGNARNAQAMKSIHKEDAVGAACSRDALS
jgi:hypothetical protein